MDDRLHGGPVGAAAEAPEAPAAGAPEPVAGRPSEQGPVDAGDEWHRVHPLSPLIRGWVVVLAILGVFVSNVVDSLFGRGGDDDGPRLDESLEGLPDWASMAEGVTMWVALTVLIAVAALVAAVVVALFSLFVWWFTRYQITPTHVRLRTGAVFRQERQTRLDRVQAIDIQRPLAPRIVGLAELHFEVADAGETSVVLRYLRRGQARELRSQLLSAIGERTPSSAGASAQEQDPAPWARGPQPARGAGPAGPEEDEFVLRVPTSRVLLSWILSPAMIWLLIFAAAAVTTMILTPGPFTAVMAGWLPALIGSVTALFRRLEGSWGFQAHRTSKGLRLSYGLLNATSQTVPLGRIQAVRVRRPLLWRLAGWSEVAINVAGYGSALETGEASSRTTLIPVATDEHLRLVLAEALGDSDAEAVSDTVLHGLTGDLVQDPQSPFTISPKRAVRIAWIVRRRRGFAVTPQEVVTVDGRLTRTCCVVPHGKIQSLEISHGPVDRWLRLRDVELHSIPGPVSPVILSMDRETAERFVCEQSERSRVAHTLVGETA